MNLIDTPKDRNLWSRASVKLHSRCSRSGRCQSALVSRNSKKESIVSGSICTLLSGMIAGLVSLDDSRHRAAGVIVTGIMDVVLARSWDAREACGLESLWSESAFNTVVQPISDNASFVKNLAVYGYVRIPRALRSVSSADPGSEGYIQRKNGACCDSSEDFGA